MVNQRSYYSLLVQQAGCWSVQFGDFTRKVVNDELRDVKRAWPRGTKFCIINTLSDQASINAAVAQLNA